MKVEKLSMEVPGQVKKNIEEIARLFPHCVTETSSGKAIDFDLLKQELQESIVEGAKERYRLEWPGKKEAQVMANLPSTNTLRPLQEESTNFNTTENLYIEGDNLEVLKLLRGSYGGKIKMIYIDPPYNTGKDFVYKDNLTQDVKSFKQDSAQVDEWGNRLVPNPETNGRYHSDWLTMMYPRLRVAFDLLSDDGVIFISIDDNEVHNLRKMCDELFGASNFLGQFVVNSTPNARDYGHIGKMHEYILFYARNILLTTTNLLKEEEKNFKYEDQKGGFNIHPLYNSNEAFSKENRPNLYYPFYLNPDSEDLKGFYSISLDKQDGWIEIFPPLSQKNQVQFVWRWGKEKARENLNKEITGYRTNEGEFRIVQKMRHKEKIIRSILSDTSYTSRKGTAEVEELLNGKIASFPKPLSLICDLIRVGANKDSYVLDFFSGSGTTAQAVMQLNAEDGGTRKFILVQIPEKTESYSEACKAGYQNLCEIGKQRIRKAASKIQNETHRNLDYGFRVYRLDSSNMTDVYHRPQDYHQKMLELFTDNIKPERSPEDLLAQIMLSWGIPLSSPIEEVVIGQKKVFKVNGKSLMACFEPDLDELFIRQIATYVPFRIIFRDSSFKDDATLENAIQLLKQLSPETEMRII